MGFRDGGIRAKLARDHLSVVWIIALDGSCNERVRPRAELDVGALSVVRLLDGCIAGGEVQEAKHMHGSTGQDEFQSGKAHRGTCQPPTIGGNQDSSIVRRDQHTVEDIAGGIGGRIARHRLERLQGFLGHVGYTTPDRGTIWEAGHGFGFGLINGFDRHLAIGDCEFEDGLVWIGGGWALELHAAALVAPGCSCEGCGGDEEAGASGLGAVDGGCNPGFQPVVQIADGQGEPGGIDGGERMVENRQLEPLEVDPGEELAGGLDRGDGNGDHG